MTPSELLALVGAWVVVGLMPGLLVTVGLRRNAGLLRNVALAPIVGYGLLMSVAVVLEVLGKPVGPVTVVIPAYAIALLCLAIGVMTRRNTRWPSTALVVRAIDVLPVVVVIVVSMSIWWSATGGLTLVPPNDDGANHGLFTTQILGLQTITPDRVVVGSVVSGSPSAAYYPFGIHLVAALVSRISGSPVASALTFEVVVAAVLLPLGMFVLTRRLFPARPGAAIVATIFSVSFVAMPYYVASWGAYPFIIGMAGLAIAIDAICGIARDAPAGGAGVVVGLSVVGLFAVHSSEAVSAVLLGLLVLVAVAVRREQRFRDSLLPLAIALFVLLAFIAPQLLQIRRGASAVAVASLIPSQTAVDSVVNALTYVTGIPNRDLVPQLAGGLNAWHIVVGGAVWLLAGIGCWVAVRDRWSPEWALALAACVLVVVASSMRLPFIDALTIPWYSRWDRLVMNLLVLLAPLAALGVLTVTAGMASYRLRLVVTGAIAAVVALPSLVVASDVAHAAYERNSLAGPDQRAAYAWLADHVTQGGSVLNDSRDGSGWMWALELVPPLFAVAPHQIDGWGDRTYLLDHAADIRTDVRAAAVAEQWSVQYAYVGPRTYLKRGPVLSADDLVAGGGWRVVFEQGGATVLERVGARS